jgi:hypothetical protein
MEVDMLGSGGRKLIRRAGALVGMTALLVGAAAGTAQATAATPAGSAPQFTLPAGAPTPGAGYKILEAYKVAAGVQTYACVANADGTTTWATASTPEALLIRYGRPGLIHHYAGPRWTSVRDGSTILGAVDVKVAQTGTIPWLLLHVAAHEKSAAGKELNDVAFVSRVNTSGGVGPTGTCTAGAQKSVPYHADYVFWVPSA